MVLLEVGCPSAKLGLKRALKTGDARLRTLDETCNSVSPHMKMTSPSGSMTLMLAISWISTDKEAKADEMFAQFSHIMGQLAIDMAGFSKIFRSAK